jgi:hypothetical protein
MKAADSVIQMQGHLCPVLYADFLTVIQIRNDAKIFQSHIIPFFERVANAPFPGSALILHTVNGDHNNNW